MTNKICLAVFIALFAANFPVNAQGKLNVVTTTEDLAAIAREVGGDHITVDSIAKGYQDPHFVEAKPSFILKLQKADLLILVGRDLEIGWLPPLIQQSRNSKVQVGADGYLDASLQARILEIPQGQITRAEGDVHPLGNPHYWLDPENGKIIAREIFDRLSRFRPNERAFFEPRLNDFLNRLNDAEKRWGAMMAPYKGTKVVTYHRSFPNFAERFGLDPVVDGLFVGALCIGLALGGAFPLWLAFVVIARYLLPALGGGLLLALGRRPELRHTITGQVSTSLILICVGGVCLLRGLHQDSSGLASAAQVVIPIATAATFVHLAWASRRAAAAPEPG